MVRTRRRRFTAATGGGRWKSEPVSCSTTLLKRVSSSSAECRRAMQTYSLPALCCDLTRRVARSTQTMSAPVTLGSRVPLWPVFSTSRIRRIQATTSCEEGFAGLSRLMTP
eukprot:Mycagemm_TRINITY_DN9666_c0_g2::TRINITY_DN9666_c0_g2_i1::g.2504::m.2504 type:complete len:111 gc:universal TRINITY_DN9666_c0_g2_i1:627-295(-)